MDLPRIRRMGQAGKKKLLRDRCGSAHLFGNCCKVSCFLYQLFSRFKGRVAYVKTVLLCEVVSVGQLPDPSRFPHRTCHDRRCFAGHNSRNEY